MLWEVALKNTVLYDEAIKHAEEAEADRQRLRRFLAMVAHDLRGPLTVVLGYTQVLRRQAGHMDPEAELRALTTIENAATQMQRLVVDLLDTARIGVGHFEIHPEHIDLMTVLRFVVEEQQATTTDHCIALEGPEHLEGAWDHDRISQLFTNLVSNAIKYSPRGGDISIEVSLEDSEVVTCVRDHGMGIPPERASQLFLPFTRVGQESLTKGSGLGLYIAKGIVDAHHGRIWVNSELGRGSVFCVALPRFYPV